ncbi:hypothetical protein LIER_06449 [Lithospermum erythrorhizon]|uniref:DUF4371 domain-containing protein n=1 Tax=Lithospermum erythrorhizon TaxID=34254 RepID=A0AAV3P676_LITER
MNQAQHITHAFERHTSQKIPENRMRLKVSIDVVLYLILQGLSLRGHDEKKQSLNRRNFLQLFKLLDFYVKEEKEIGTLPENATYTSGQTQKEIIEIISQKVR